MIYNCLVVDDEELARDLIAGHIQALEEFTLIATCASALEARKVLQTEKIDLIFLDIEMPLLKGTDFAKTLAAGPKIIFTTAYRNYAVEGFEVNALDYLLKPITFDRFFRAIKRFLDEAAVHLGKDLSSAPQREFMFLRVNRKQVKIYLDHMLYVESLKDYIRIHTTTKSYMVKFSISAFIAKLDARFLRVHRSFIVNMDKITAYTRHDIEIGTIEIAIGEQYRKTVSAYLEAE